MTLPDAKTLLQLKKEGLSWVNIGNKFGVTRQRVQSKATGYTVRYQKSERFLMYHRHKMHDKDSKLRKPCDFCKKEIKMSSNQCQ